MSITEEDRYRLYQKLEATLGAEEASTLMEHLPPVGWADVTTKRDLDHIQVVWRSDVDLLEATMRAGLAEMRTEMEQFKAEMRAEMDAFSAEMRAEMAAFKVEVRNELEDVRTEMRRDFRTTIFTLLAANATFAGVVLAVVKLG